MGCDMKNPSVSFIYDKLVVQMISGGPRVNLKSGYLTADSERQDEFQTLEYCVAGILD